MKKLILLLLAACALNSAEAQIFNRYKRQLNNAGEKNADLLKGGADFVLDPIETVPEKTSKRPAISAQTNWGKDYLLPPALAQRLRDECTYKVTVKVADTGMPAHAALRQGQIQGSNYTSAASVADLQGHSTHVSGIIAGDEVGICDALVDKGLLSHKAVKILADNGSGSFDWVKNAVAAERADDKARIERGEFVVWNGSFGGGTGLIEGVEAELQKSTAIGAVFCFAAGNTGQAGVNYPGSGKYSIACASLDQGLSRSSYSTTGPEVWAAMPGRGINSTYLNNTWAMLSGTSMATPFLAAATAVGFSKWGAKMGDLARVRAYIAWCCKDLGAIGKDNEYGYGVELIQNVLDRDPSQTPGIVPPPPPPPPADPGGYSVTPLTVTLAKEYAVLWDNLSPSAAASEAKTFKTGGRGSRKANQGLALKTVKVRITASVPSKKAAAAAAKELESKADGFFSSRGFMLPAGQDESWAAYWAAYFMEMLLEMGGYPVDVVKVSHVSGGQTVETTNLKHWPVK